MGTRETFRESLKYWRKKKGLSQEKLSELIGYGETYITEIESRHKFPKPETIDIICDKLDIEPFQLFQKPDPVPERAAYGIKVDYSELAERFYTNFSSKLKDQIEQTISEVIQEK